MATTVAGQARLLRSQLRSGRSAEAQRAVLQLQRQYGNRHVQRVLKIVRQTEDEEEGLQTQRYDRDEEEVARVQLQRQVAGGDHQDGPTGRHAEDEEDLQVKRRGGETSEVVPEVEAAINRKRGGGQTLDSGMRVQMGGAFGADFGGVRVHTDAEADTLNRALGARAFTTGRDVFFRQGEYNPATSSGQELLAHELTHVVQQGEAREFRSKVQRLCSECEASSRKERDANRSIRTKLMLGADQDAYEQEADRMAQSVVQNVRLQVLEGQEKPVRREPGGKAFRRFPLKGVVRRAAASCPSTWATTVRADHSRALGMIDRARSKLLRYDGTQPADMHTSLSRHFGATGSIFAGWVRLNLGLLRTLARLADYECEDTSSWWCGTHTLAKTMWCVPCFDIRVCEPLYFSQSARERSATLIHEWVHKYGCNFDLGYSHEPEYGGNWTITQLMNADPFAELVKDIS